MHVGTHSHGNWHNHVYSGPPSRGERLVARHDQDNDGKLSPSELKDTRIGRRMSVDRFARLDKNDDGMLAAGELGGKKARRDDGPSLMERVMVARFADHMAEKVELETNGADIADAIMARLDGDESGGLNSEEIAGTRLAEKIGDGFYDLDGDKNGALDKAELNAFITNEYLGRSKGGMAADMPASDHGGDGDDADAGDVAVAKTVETEDVAAADDPVAEANEVQQATSTGSAGASQVAYVDQIRASFEAALEVLQNGSDQRSAYDVVRTLYEEVNGVLGGP